MIPKLRAACNAFRSVLHI